MLPWSPPSSQNSICTENSLQELLNEAQSQAEGIQSENLSVPTSYCMFSCNQRLGYIAISVTPTWLDLTSFLRTTKELICFLNFAKTT